MGIPNQLDTSEQGCRVGQPTTSRGSDERPRIAGFRDAEWYRRREAAHAAELQRIADEHWGQLLERLGPQRYSKTLDQFRPYGDSQSQADQEVVLSRINGFIGAMPENCRECANLLLIGTKGTGKDFLMSNVMRHAVLKRHWRGEWVNGISLFQRLYNATQGAGGETVAEIIYPLQRAPFLAISDPTPMKGPLTPAQSTNLLSIVDHRYRQKLPTWITMNVDNRQEAETRLGSQNIDRLAEGATVLILDWPSYREQQ